jgi:hypothetical protein
MNSTGRQFGKLIVIEDLGISDLLCQCECGNVKTIKRYYLIRLKSRGVRSCGCQARGKRPRNVDAGVRLAYAEKKSLAKRIGVRFELSLDQYKRLINQNCHYCDAAPVLRGRENYKFIGQESLDRKDPNGPYTIDNVVPACLTCNRKKRDTSYDSYVCSLKLVV